MSGRTILVVDDEPTIRDALEYTLVNAGFSVLTAAHGAAALSMMEASHVDLLVVDVLMPELDGLSLCREVRARSDTPIVFLSSRTDEVDRVIALEMGGDDYVDKPFSPRELVARIRSVLRRSNGPILDRHITTHGTIRINKQSFTVTIDADNVQVTASEFRILWTLLAHPNRAYSRQMLIRAIHEGGEQVTERTIDTHVRRIRAKLRPFGLNPIETINGVGYRASKQC